MRRESLSPWQFLLVIVLLLTWYGCAEGGLTLTLAGPLDLGGLEFGDEEEEYVYALDVEPMTGQLWILGYALSIQEPHNGFHASDDVFVVDPNHNELVLTFGLQRAGTALAIDPVTGNLFLPWYRTIEDKPNRGEVAEVSQRDEPV